MLSKFERALKSAKLLMHSWFLRVQNVPVKPDHTRWKSMPYWWIRFENFKYWWRALGYRAWSLISNYFPCKFTLYTQGGCVHALRTLRLSEFILFDTYLPSWIWRSQLSPQACHWCSLAKCFMKDSIFERATTWLANLKVLISFDTLHQILCLICHIKALSVLDLPVYSVRMGTFCTRRNQLCIE